MKTYFRVLAIIFVMTTFSCTVQQQLSAQPEAISIQVFYDELSPYGQWIENPEYGYVWIPDVDADFAPYASNGYWVMTDYGWTWNSGYEWGWAAFHYGRWDFDNNYGWFWVPGYEWGPSWVIWRQSEGYYGWTPMRPGININMSFSNGYQDVDRWNFIRDRDFGRPDMDNYYVDRSVNNVIIVNSMVIRNTYIDNNRHTTNISGPRREEVQHNSGRNFVNVTIRNNDRPGQRLSNNQMEIYRPKLQKSNVATQRYAPTRVTNIQDVKPTKDRNSNRERYNNSSPNRNNKGEGHLPIQQNEVGTQPQQRPVDSRQPVQLQQPVRQPERTQQDAQPVQQQPAQQPERQQQPRQAAQPVQQQPAQQPERQQQPRQDAQPTQQRQQQPVQQTERQQQPRQDAQPVQQPAQQTERQQQPRQEPQKQEAQPARQLTKQKSRQGEQKQPENKKAENPKSKETKSDSRN